MPDSVPFEIILRSPWGGPWRRFSRPFQVIAAHDQLDVRDALAQIDHAVRGGAYAAGFVTYEAAGALGLPVQQPGAGLPLLCFGLFSPDQIESLNRFPAAGAASLGEWHPSIDHAAYLRAIGRIKSSIEAGDTYQINFTFRLTAAFEGDPAALMSDLYVGQAGPWSAYVEAGDHVICSASPELFFSLEGERLLCRPMKGTAPRGYWIAQDDALGRALRDSEKNRAENVMIVDMVRNDIGRIARVGSVRATSLFDVERYPLQWQMTSTVEGAVETRSLLRLFEAMFPSGSITGAPKHSSMDIIRE
nr:chorismate-binding protein [Acidobacteriota bacterium]